MVSWVLWISLPSCPTPTLYPPLLFPPASCPWYWQLIMAMWQFLPFPLAAQPGGSARTHPRSWPTLLRLLPHSTVKRPLPASSCSLGKGSLLLPPTCSYLSFSFCRAFLSGQQCNGKKPTLESDLRVGSVYQHSFSAFCVPGTMGPETVALKDSCVDLPVCVKGPECTGLSASAGFLPSSFHF